MPAELCAAHRENDMALIAAYGFEESMIESEILAALMKNYQKLTGLTKNQPL